MDNKVRYGNGDGVIEITVRSDTGAKEQFLRSNLSDRKNLWLISKLLFDKYGIDLNPRKDLVNHKSLFDF